MFTLHPQLEQDTFPLGALSLSTVLLMNNAYYPWVILVPQQPDLREITDLQPYDYRTLAEEIREITKMMQALFAPAKMNVAALGNVVPQLHVHIIARYNNDEAWPAPVWGKAARPYTPHEQAIIVKKLQEGLKKLAS